MGMPKEIGMHILPYWKFFHDNIIDFCYKKYIKQIPDYQKDLRKYHNIHKGKRCFILGTGPSINKTDLNLIKDEILIGVNMIANASKQYNINFKYYAIVDDADLKIYFKQLSDSDAQIFLSGDATPKYIWNKSKYDIYLNNKPILTKYVGTLLDNENNVTIGDIEKGVYSGCTVIGFALQLAFYMGFKECYLVGCDCSYGNTNQHFNGVVNKRFFGEDNDEVWYAIFDSYLVLKNFFEKNKRKIYNSTVGGNLEIFERISLEEIKGINK